MQSRNADYNDEAPDEFNNDDGIEHDHLNFDGVGKGEGKIDESQPKILPTMVLHRLIRWWELVVLYRSTTMLTIIWGIAAQL